MTWVWNTLLLLLRLFIILSVFTAIGVAASAIYAWWNGADPWAAWSVALGAVLLGGFMWYWIIL